MLVPVLLLLLSACGSRGKKDADISAVECPAVKIHRYDLDLFAANNQNLAENLRKMLPEYMLFLGDTPDNPTKLSALREYLDSPRNQDFIKAVRLKYPELKGLEEDLTSAFRHFKYYFPSFHTPQVYAYISGGDYEYPVQFNDSVLLIGLDNYLGQGYQPYRADGVPLYRLGRMESSNIVPDCSKLLAASMFPVETGGGSLLDMMVEAGKRLFVLDAILPELADNIKIGYTGDQLSWIRKNEFQVWAAIIENRMLYTNDGKIIRVFMSDGPFTAEFSKESPPMLGSWIGWRIVEQYMERNPDISIQELLKEKDSQKILAGSKYKPEK